MTEPNSFLRQFFGAGNRFDYDAVQEQDGETYRAIRRWTRALVKQEQPTVLPRWTDEGVRWYGLARTEQQAQHLVEEVSAFIGPSYSTFDGGRATLDPNDPVERAVEAFTGGRALRFSGDDAAIRKALQRLHDVRERREPHWRGQDLDVGLLMRRFNMALQAGERRDAEEHLGHLRDRNLLDSDNLSYLTVRMLAAFEAWEELLERGEIARLVRLEERPLAVSRALLQAMYHVHFAAYEREGNPEEAVERFTAVVQPEYGDLFTVRSSMQAPEVLKVFMMQAVSEEPADWRLMDRLRETAERAGLEDTFFEDLATLADTKVPVDREATEREEQPSTAAAMRAWGQGRTDEAFRLLRGAEASAQKAQLLVMLAGTLQSLDAESELAETLAQLDEPDRQNLIQQHQVCRRVTVSGTPPTGWTTWFNAVGDEGYSSSEQALSYAEKLSEEWHPQVLLTGAGESLEALVQAVESAPLDGRAGRTVSRALPRLIEALRRDPAYPRSAFEGLYRAIHGRIPYVADLTKSDFDVYLDLAGVLLDLGSDAVAYRDLIDGALLLWEEDASARRIDWLLDFAELLVLAPARDDEAQVRFLTIVVSAIRKHEKHIEPMQVEFFRGLCSEIGHPEVAADLRGKGHAEEDAKPEGAMERVFGGQTLGIYTLTVSAGRRVKSFLEERCAGATVHLRHDKGGSAELHRIAENADFFLVVTRSATHAATEVIEQHVPTERLIRPRGKGESSMIRDLAAYARERE